MKLLRSCDPWKATARAQFNEQSSASLPLVTASNSPTAPLQASRASTKPQTVPPAPWSLSSSSANRCKSVSSLQGFARWADQHQPTEESRRRVKARSLRERTLIANYSNALADRDTVGRQRIKTDPTFRTPVSVININNR